MLLLMKALSTSTESFGSYEDTFYSVVDNYHSLLRLFEADLTHGLGTKFISSQVTMRSWPKHGCGKLSLSVFTSYEVEVK
jgi:hypothetical protein